MTKVGEYPIDRSDGGRDFVDLYEPGTFGHDPLLVQLSDGRYGVPYLEPVGDGDTGLLVQDSAGNWWQVSKQGIRLIEDWESGQYNSDRWNWEDTDFSGSATVHDYRSLYGQYSLNFQDYRVTAAMPDYPDPAPNLPYQLDEILQFHFQIPHSGDMDTGQQYWFGYLLQTAPHHTTTSAGDQTWDDCFTAEVITGSNDLFRISERKNGSVNYFGSKGSLTVDWTAGQWYRGEAHANVDATLVRLYEHAGGDNWNYLGNVDGGAPDWNSGGVLIRSSGGGESDWDTIRKVPDWTPYQ